MKTLQDLELFVRTAELGSLSAAARRLELTPAAASAALKRLEAALQAPLFVRSTRSLRLTAEGEVFVQHCRQALELLAEGRAAVTSGRAVVRGVLQLSLPSDLGRNVLLPWLDAFQQHHPAVALRLQLSDRLADVYRQPVDLTIRYGTLPDSSLVALPLVPGNRRVLCASPDYLARAGVPASPAELVGHNCLCFMLGEAVHDRWRFFRDGQEQSVAVRGDRVSDDGDVVRRWALAGHGLAYKSRLDVHADLQAGRLVAVCADWQGELAPLNLLCADRRQLSPAVQQLRDFLTPRLTAL
ncbi:LysR family transcriptional regulator [Denitromonas sp.]|uniref:LysR family transcriptional regulator n=1 Tax=Denitromonas sp. TaxID=2734609 RepID=UPI002AFE64C3|nr:LysR family transcriptional regulator [Denitromonas sp.]